VTLLEGQLEGATDSLQQSFAGLMLQYAAGDAIDTMTSSRLFPFQMTSVCDFITTQLAAPRTGAAGRQVIIAATLGELSGYIAPIWRDPRGCLSWPPSGTFQVERRVFRCFLGGSPAFARNDVGGVPPRPVMLRSGRFVRAVVLLCFFQKVSQRRDV
jgi:hypothetical protein